MRAEENWAVASGRIGDFLRGQPDVRETGGVFRYRESTVRLVPQTGRAMGKWEIPRTQVIFEGDGDDVRAIRRRLFLRFLSAGG